MKTSRALRFLGIAFVLSLALQGIPWLPAQATQSADMHDLPRAVAVCGAVARNPASADITIVVAKAPLNTDSTTSGEHEPATQTYLLLPANADVSAKLDGLLDGISSISAQGRRLCVAGNETLPGVIEVTDIYSSKRSGVSVGSQ